MTELIEQKASLHFEPYLYFFLNQTHRKEEIQIFFKGRQSVKHLIESLGVPHTEVGRILINSLPAQLSDITRDGDDIDVHAPQPVLQHDTSELNPTFVIDNHLGKLAHYLRLLGFDCYYDSTLDDENLAKITVEEERILLTRDRHLLMRKAINTGYCVRSLQPDLQVIEVIERFALSRQIRPFCRCLNCNHLLHGVEKPTVIDHLLPLTIKYFDEFYQCTHCKQIYWRGSHYDKMSRFIEKIMAQLNHA
jgi:uncharacterized protein